MRICTIGTKFAVYRKGIDLDMLLTEFDEKWYYNKVREEGENRMASLTNLLINTDRIDDLTKATNDKAYRQKLFQEFGL